MKTSKTLPAITRIAKFTLTDEVRQKSFLILFVFCALCVFLLRGCYHGNYMVNGQTLDAETVVKALSKVTFHVIGAGVMVITALLAMRIFRRDRNEGLHSCVLSKPIARWQYLTGKIIGLWVLSLLFMFILHGVIFLITSINLQIVMLDYLVASLLCAINLLFVVLAVLLLSLLMPEIVAFLCVLGVGAVGFVADGIAAVSQSQIVLAITQQPGSGPQSEVTWWKVVYFVWPKLLGVQQSATSLLGNEPFTGFGSLYPFLNVLVYCLILCVLLFWRFRKEDLC
ncbi:MAG: ABC transporter permease [Geobacteraceae bacterium]